MGNLLRALVDLSKACTDNAVNDTFCAVDGLIVSSDNGASWDRLTFVWGLTAQVNLVTAGRVVQVEASSGPVRVRTDGRNEKVCSALLGWRRSHSWQKVMWRSLSLRSRPVLM